jgi:inosose dehydratase
MTDHHSSPDLAGPARARFRVGSAPDSWGVWFPDDPRQTPWTRFLDEIARAGYEWLELGPFGYLPSDAGILRSELGSRGLRLAGGTVGGALHRRADRPAIQARMLDVARLAAELGAGHVVFLPAMYRDLSDGRELEPAELDADQWRALIDGAAQLARVLAEETGMRFVFHPHAESHVQTDEQVRRFLADTDPATLAQVEAEHLSFADAVQRDVMCEPGLGVPALDEVTAALRSLPDGTFVIVEQDLYPCDVDRPYLIAARTRKTLQSAGIG